MATINDFKSFIVNDNRCSVIDNTDPNAIRFTVNFSSGFSRSELINRAADANLWVLSRKIGPGPTLEYIVSTTKPSW